MHAIVLLLLGQTCDFGNCQTPQAFSPRGDYQTPMGQLARYSPGYDYDSCQSSRGQLMQYRHVYNPNKSGYQNARYSMARELILQKNMAKQIAKMQAQVAAIRPPSDNERFSVSANRR